MSLKRKVLGAGTLGLASIPLMGDLADKTTPKYQRNQPTQFIRRGRVVENPFEKRRKSRRKAMQTAGAIAAGTFGAAKVPKLIGTVSKSLGNREFKNTTNSIDTAIAIAKRYQAEVGDKALMEPLLFKRHEKQFLKASDDIKKLTALKKSFTKQKVKDIRGKQLLGLRGTGTQKKVDQIIGSPTVFGSSTKVQKLDPDHLYHIYSSKLNKMR